MKKILLRADDLGYSEAVNYGIEKSIREGLIGSLGIMVNMPATEHGVNLIMDYDIALGVHVNICAEKPLTDPNKIPSLVDENGYFHSSKKFRTAIEDFVDYDEAVIEIDAQYHRFLELFGRKPDYFEGHAVASENFFKALEYIADKYSLKYSGMSFGGEPIKVGCSIVQFNMESMLPNYDPFAMIQKMIDSPKQEVVQLAVFHPGYLDDYILTNSSLTIPRTKEVAILTNPQVKEWIAQQNVQLISYRDL